ncbi:hypothetical protein B0T26DRAFT_738230 [Lasiosphaeria miniovina]|uniref:Chromate transporter n=1 Tax=Lasiosphaeria miniovina TaxID=1954250 RepID=A0AA40E9Q8_9PEZI|nr:uncharacterized protein B0T26DRAFT_738230 [Lasiosphaeria miniovina]KAK0727563.1 hypothetical protein B0T26DRAFT_738230 [Lasiosphaeria miniovina]
MATGPTPSEPTLVAVHEKKADVESQNADLAKPDSGMPISDSPSPDDDLGLSDNSNFFFYSFGLFACGGPLVVQDKWITLARSQPAFSVYQILPGLEAAGLTGGIVAGVAFALPGFNKYSNASFRALQPIVTAMIRRATRKIAEHSVKKHDTKKTDPFLAIAAICTAINTALRIVFVASSLSASISLGLYGVIYTFVARRLWIPAAALFVLQYVGYAFHVVFRGVPSPVALALGMAKTPSLVNLFVLGSVAGTLSVGGAYTAIPFVQTEAVLLGAWLPHGVFIYGIAIGNILPAPLVIFATFVGAVVITLGMFFPCFLFTIAGHELLEKLVRNKFTHKYTALLLVIMGAVVGQFPSID